MLYLQLRDMLMKPEQLAKLGRQIEEQHCDEPAGLPRDVFGEGVKQRLQAQFDATQMAAISVRCTQQRPSLAWRALSRP